MQLCNNKHATIETRNTYSKPEKLKSRKLIDQLFTKGKSLGVFPLKVFYTEMPVEAKQSVQAGVGVSARNFRKAVDRNRIKRLLREAYRLNKTILHEALASKEKKLAVFFLYTGNELPEFVLLNEKMRKALEKLAATIQS